TLMLTAGTRTPRMMLTEAPVDGLSDGGRWRLPVMPPGAHARVRYQFTAERRGQFTLPDATVVMADPLRLWEDNHALPGHTTILVIPHVVALSGLPPASGTQSSASGPRSPGGSSGDLGTQVRPYVPGDDLRSIHWRVTARREELMVRQREPAIHGG